MKILQISSELAVGSIGRISEHINNLVQKEGWQSFIAYGREAGSSSAETFRIGDKVSLIRHGIETRLFDNHGLASRGATKKLVDYIQNLAPDLIHLHHLHGYYVNYEILFNYLRAINIPVVWTFHDCWSFTGHCAHYEYAGCYKWKTQCENCPQKKEYPQSLLKDNSFSNYLKKKKLFNSLANLTIVPVSYWLERS